MDRFLSAPAGGLRVLLATAAPKALQTHRRLQVALWRQNIGDLGDLEVFLFRPAIYQELPVATEIAPEVAVQVEQVSGQQRRLAMPGEARFRERRVAGAHQHNIAEVGAVGEI